MTASEFVSSIKSRGATVYAAPDARSIELANTGLQARRFAMLPREIREFYTVAGGANLGSGYIFGPADINRGAVYPVPSIVRVNDDFSRNLQQLNGCTIFGRNDLFFFAFDAFGAFYMLENLNFRVLKKYDDGWRAMADCIIGGRI